MSVRSPYYISLDDDGDGAIDEDCVVKNAVVPFQNETIMVGETTTLKWTVYAMDFSSFSDLTLYKRQVSCSSIL